MAGTEKKGIAIYDVDTGAFGEASTMRYLMQDIKLTLTAMEFKVILVWMTGMGKVEEGQVDKMPIIADFSYQY
ncbi:hypothetical protein FOMG_19533 [Fusarium oxysporum f. sp. melonis 26406]|nr:hypothetical protein FOMG_19533 [Fusarium oxysporum f. sp. melonis 26406]